MSSRVKLPVQPLCRCCGNPIGKYTCKVLLREKREGDTQTYHDSTAYEFMRTLEVEKLPINREEAQRLTNRQIVSLSYWPKTEDKPRRLSGFSEWDGETYADEFFCKNDCAIRFARLCAMHQTGEKPLVKLFTKAHIAAIEARNAGREQQEESTNA